MKKFLCILLTVILLVTGVIAVPVGAVELDMTSPADSAIGDYAAPEFVGIQTRINNEGEPNETQDIRFVATVASTKGKLLGFAIYANGEVYRAEGHKVYTQINAGNKIFQASDKGAEALFVAVITDVPTDLTGVQFDVRTYIQYGEENTAVRSYNSTFEMNGKSFQKELTSPYGEWATQGGTGTEENPYVLTQDNFVTFYEKNIWVNNSTYFGEGMYFSLESDVTINTGNAKDWETTPPTAKTYGHAMANFKGTFNGNHHRISGLYVKTDGGDANNFINASLFNTVESSGVVRNVRIINSYFEIISTRHSGAASIAGQLNGGLIENCYSDAVIRTESVDNEVELGGFVGMSNAVNSRVNSCVFAGDIKGESCELAGGIVGKCNSGDGTLSITNCLNLGSIKAKRAGAILANDSHSGDAVSTVTNCINLSKAIVTVSDGVESDWNCIYGNKAPNVTVNTYVIEEFMTKNGVANTVNSNVTVTYVALAEFLALGALEGWYFKDGYIPCPIEGLEIELDPYLTEWGIDTSDTEQYRILITSDMHYTNLYDYSTVGMDKDTRLQLWVNGILAEHEKDPFDLIVILGDMSLDYWGWNDGGSWQREPQVSETALFIEKYVSQLPEDVPTLVLPGNHELYANEKWKELTGYDRSETFVLGNNLFIIPDSFAGAVDPEYVGGGTNDAPYQALDMDFINSALEAHPECTNVFLLSHHFDLDQESEAFKTLLQTDERMVGLFSGHTHKSNVIELGSEYRDLCIAQTGGFLSPGTWGYRDLVITNNKIVSKYIVPECEYYVDGTKYTTARMVTDDAALKLGENLLENTLLGKNTQGSAVEISYEDLKKQNT